VFVQVKGVLDVESGYCNGQSRNPTYEQVCSGLTGHNEVVQLVYDPQVISTRVLLEIFFVIHDPTTLNRQGYDVGTQYRSAIFTVNDEQARLAKALVSELNNAGTFGAPIVTEIVALERFWVAEAYHQNYFARNPFQGYCVGVVAPKVAKFRKQFASYLK
ncbi:MAG: peptide-methionine (S)-S-oxide reductase, partial [Betaproteobacteria bacterium]|nr:peptide-methionine (S)-S-oxide reductase [Betaproteobacteria bacterium]